MLGRFSSIKFFRETPPGTLAPRDLPRLLDWTPHRLMKSPPIRVSPKDSSKGSSKSSSKSSSTSRAQRRRAHQPGDAAADSSGSGGSVHDPFDRDGEMQSLSSQDDAWDPNSSKRSSLAQVDVGERILEEEDEEDDPRESGVCVSDLGLELWEEWRAEFPLEVLNGLAEFFEGCEVREDGSRAACLGRVGEALSGALALDREAVDREAVARGMVPPGAARGDGGAPPEGEPGVSAPDEELRRWGRPLPFAALPGLLDFARGVVSRVEKEDPGRLWSGDALQEVQLIFRRNMNALERLPVAQLFQALGALGLEVLREGSVETQRWLVDVTKVVVDDRGTRASKLGVGSISFQEFLQIATVALREKERQRRRSEFQLEQAAWRQAGFRLLEAEDLRELHGAFAAAAGDDSTVEMLRLLESCGVRKLRQSEVAALRAIVDGGGGGGDAAAHQPGADAGQGAASLGPAEKEVPFHRFVVWMQCVYEEGIGDLTLQGKGHEAEAAVTLGELENYSGFVAAMARERILQRPGARRPPAAAADGGDGLASPDGCPVRRRSSAASSQGGSAPASRRSSLGLIFPLGRDLSCGASKVSASRLPSRIVSLQPSRATSRSASKAAAVSRAASKVRVAVSRVGSKAKALVIPTGGPRAGGPPPPAAAQGGGAAAGGDGSSGVLQLKGLPPSEAMLGRKPFRPSSAVRNSVDHGGARAQEPAAPSEGGESRGGADAGGSSAAAAASSPLGSTPAPQGQQQARSGSGSSGAPSAGGSAGSTRRPWEPDSAQQAELLEPGRPAGGPGSPPVRGGACSQPSAQRQVKTAQDASALVCGAVAKLETLLRERGAGEGTGPQTSDRPVEVLA